ncbi:MAG TPA: hypothetical protein VIT23_03450 [Terrimicrobiaceae bacterium]
MSVFPLASMELHDQLAVVAALPMPFSENLLLCRSQRTFVVSAVEGVVDFDRIEWLALGLTPETLIKINHGVPLISHDPWRVTQTPSSS